MHEIYNYHGDHIIQISIEMFSFQNATDPRYLTIDSKHLKSAHMRKTNVHAKKLLDGVKQFNSDPKRGLSN